ncbi:Os12g0218100 [Oryza sativa Japonica Group]|uniref:Os12g0218100 protein n=1 Tax=Oryza sativa subsp. japonica TaxID=39947 RepID=Q2QVU4_ORYSJ|nr:hypothetical protein LOC_Os12g11620 [Oryza sativa Japonica Group]BAG88584.1 unnamed protein product [Oryza sativa Japonica Group]BAT16356.1 Os12g0218100 [Oryza sativa Japonica Group]
MAAALRATGGRRRLAALLVLMLFVMAAALQEAPVMASAARVLLQSGLLPTPYPTCNPGQYSCPPPTTVP